MTEIPAVRVRIATADDAARLLPMYEAFYGAYFRPKTVEAIHEHLAAASAIDTVLVAELGREPVGFASLRILPQIENDLPHAELPDIFVEDRQRRQGVGRALLRAAEDLARERGSVRLFLVTGLGNDETKAFHRASGFTDFALAMKKNLEGMR